MAQEVLGAYRMTLCYVWNCGCAMCTRQQFEKAFYARPQSREVAALLHFLWELVGRPVRGYG